MKCLRLAAAESHIRAGPRLEKGCVATVQVQACVEPCHIS
jgi:hypothetical protein